MPKNSPGQSLTMCSFSPRLEGYQTGKPQAKKFAKKMLGNHCNKCHSGYILSVNDSASHGQWAQTQSRVARKAIPLAERTPPAPPNLRAGAARRLLGLTVSSILKSLSRLLTAEKLLI